MKPTPLPELDQGLSRRRIIRVSGLLTATAAASGLTLPRRASAAASGPQTPAIFYSPHQDDEALGMAGSILEHKEAGRPVYLVLMTAGEDGALRAKMNGGACFLRGRCPAPGHTHALGWKGGDGMDDEVVRGRTDEFRLSASRLGVDRIYLTHSRAGIKCLPAAMRQTDPVYDEFVDALEEVFRTFAYAFPGASHKFAAGWLDGNVTHKACSDAAHRLRDEVHDMRFYHIYAYVQRPVETRGHGADKVLHLSPKAMAHKRRVLDSYRTWDPGRDLYALGYHSVPSWFDHAYTDPREFVYTLPDDYVPGKPVRSRSRSRTRSQARARAPHAAPRIC